MTRILPAAALVLALALPGAGAAQICPAPPDHRAEIEALYAQMLIATDETEARDYVNALWGYWTRAPDEAAQSLLDQGMAQRAQYDLLGASRTLGKLTEYCPDYAEGWNQRAFARFLAGQFDLALGDLDRALELQPRHLGALTGKARSLIALDRKAEAILVLREALALNPWLGERHMLPALEAEEHDI